MLETDPRMQPAPRPGPRRPAPALPIHPDAIRAYDIRGSVGEQVLAAGFRRIGQAFATMAGVQGLRRIAVGRDGRTTSPDLEQALVEGLVEGGAQVTRLGLLPTPALAFGVRRLDLDGGVMVTASHNPPGENGLKLLLGGQRIYGQALRDLVASEPERRSGGGVEEQDILQAYVAALARGAESLPPMTVAWDCGNGATGPAVRELTRRLPGRHILLHVEVDGRFPNHHPDPAVEPNLADLRAVVRAQGCDAGFAFDGDGDRIGAVAGDGRIVWSDQLLLLLAQDLLARRPGAVVVGDVKCSRRLFEGIAACGGRAVMAPSGYVLVRETMRRQGALLGGELSGHMFFADDWHGVDDALHAAVRTLKAISRRMGGLAGFLDGLPPSAATPELRIPCRDPARVVARTHRRLAGRGAALDARLGLRVDRPEGWWLLRASGTEAKVTCRCEAEDAEGLARLTAELYRELRASGVEPPAASSDSASR